MKTFKELYQEYTTIREEAKTIEDWFVDGRREQREKFTLQELKNNKEKMLQVLHDFKEREKEKSDRLYLLQVAQKYLMDNMRRAYYAETMPTVLEVLRKYENKPLGEKTKDRIREEVKQRAGAWVYITSPYRYCSDEIHLHPVEHEYLFHPNDIVILVKNTDTNEKRPIIGGDAGNRLQVYDMEDYMLYDCGNYVEDYMGAAAAAISRYKELKGKLEKLDADCREFNNTLPAGINHIESYSWRMNHKLV